MEITEANALKDAVNEVLQPEIERFANSFPNEYVLQERLETLFSKIPSVSGVKILQGTQEYGKDLVFYERGTCGERRLIACVVKNDKISGSISAQSGASRVLFQVRQALKNAYVGAKGEAEFVNHVYVITPWPCSQEAMNSIKGELESAKGQVQFVCGRDLFDLFHQFWPSYIYFESNLLSLYLATVEQLDENSAFANLMTRGGFVVEGIASLSRIYIPQSFLEVVPTFILAEPFPGWRGLNSPMSQSDIRQLQRLFEDTKTVLNCARIWSSVPSDEIDHVLVEIDQLARLLSERWKNQYNAAVEKARAAEELPPSEKRYIAPPVLDTTAEGKVRGIEAFASRLKVDFDQITGTLSRIGVAPDSTSLTSEPYLSLSKLKLASIEFPWVLDMQDDGRTSSFPADLLDHYGGPLLIAGSAGFGKTSFCRMATLRDSAQFANKTGGVIPTYVQLYQLNSQEVNGDEDPTDIFIPSADLKRYVKEKAAADEKVPLRAYLDGLDEVTDPKRRSALMKLARTASESGKFQVVVTSRAHVVGPHLDWLPRVSLAPFDDGQLTALAQKWLDKSECDRFLAELQGATDLHRIIRVPLLANLTLAIFKEIGALPEGTVRLYEMFIQLLCGGWDSAKNIRRESEFGSGPKRTVITRVAWIAHNSRNRDFSEVDFRTGVGATLTDLASRAKDLLRECVQDGILIQGGDRFAFAHLSFQEFLVANHLNDPKGARQRQALRQYLEGDSWWDEVLRFFVAGAEDPNEIAKWIADTAEQVAARARSHPAEIKAKAGNLIDSLQTYHKGFQPEKRTKKTVARLDPTVPRK
jgi:hypothetical protein